MMVTAILISATLNSPKTLFLVSDRPGLDVAWNVILSTTPSLLTIFHLRDAGIEKDDEDEGSDGKPELLEEGHKDRRHVRRILRSRCSNALQDNKKEDVVSIGNLGIVESIAHHHAAAVQVQQPGGSYAYALALY